MWGTVPASAIRNPVCNNFTAACAAEKEGRFTDAFIFYESVYSECGDLGWGDVGAGRGAHSVAFLRTTPCGMPVAVKRMRFSTECDVLQLVTTPEAVAACPGCFPRCYYYSRATLADYVELLPGRNETIPLTSFFEWRPHPHIHAIKSIFTQAVSALLLLRSNGWEHNDVSRSNMIVVPKKLEDGSTFYKAILFDLGNARPAFVRSSDAGDGDGPRRVSAVASPADPSGNSEELSTRALHASRRLHGNGHHTDTYTLAREFFAMARYYGRHTHRGSLSAPVQDNSTMESAMWDIMEMYPDEFSEPDVKRIKQRLRSVTTLATIV